MFRSMFACSSLIVLAACTQPAVTVENRGHESFTKSGSSLAYNTAAPVAPVSYSAPEAPRQQMAFSQQPAQTAPLNSSIAVSELEPAAGKAEAKIEAKPAPVIDAKTSAEPVAPNAWTKKPRDTASFGSEKPAASSPSGAQYIWPVASRNVTAAFGKGSGKANDGISIAAANGEPVWAAADGEVIYADSKMQGYGKMVIVKHAGGRTTTYAHLARYGVEKYDRVKQGDILGYVGSTGKVNKPQLYFSMRDGTKAVDPQQYLDRKVAGL